MINNIFFSVISLFYSIMIIIIYFSKKRLPNEENNVYKYLIICNFLGLIIEIFPATLAIRYLKNFNPNLTIFILKFILYYFIVWISLFTYYIYLICITDCINQVEVREKKLKKIKKFLTLLGILCIIFITFLPLYVHEVNYTYGPSANLVYLVSGLLIVSWIYFLLRNIHYIKSKKYTPVFTFIVLGSLVMLIQSMNPQLTLMIPMQTFITFLMYFTIENPDIKMLNELYKSKELAEQNYVEKYNFLFETAQEVRKPLNDIKKITNEIKIEDKTSIQNGLDLIKNMIKHLDFTINNILDISIIDVSKLKLIDTKYSLENICEDISLRIEKEIAQTIKFEKQFPKKMPILYGDYIKLKQIIYSILMNSVKRLDSGYILFKIDLLERYDTCRIVFTISDNGSGLPIERINEILSSTGEFSKEDLMELEKKEINMQLCQKVIKIMGGSLMIKSELERGTETKLVIDQRVYHEEQEDIIEKYINSINNYRKVLIVSQNKELISKLKKLCNSYNITYTNIFFGMDAVDRLKSGKKYDFILVEDEMKQMSGYTTLNSMKKINGFKIPVIIMLNNDKKQLKNHFLKDGFSDYLLTDNLNSEFERIINKY